LQILAGVLNLPKLLFHFTAFVLQETAPEKTGAVAGAADLVPKPIDEASAWPGLHAAAWDG